MNKYEREYNQIINIWGADHHGYIARMQAAIKALNKDTTKFKIILVQFASLYRGDIQQPMTTRGGEFVTLKELRHEIGKDAARFFYLMRKCDQHMKFDLELAKQKTQENPVYYIQYAYARICSVLRKATEQGKIYSPKNNNNQKYLNLLQQKTEKDLIASLEKFPQQIEIVVNTTHLHKLCYYLQQLAKQLHIFYNSNPILSCDDDVIYARLALISAVAVVLKNGLNLLGLQVMERM
jgi:arginyl-tRNA synthetase